MTTATISRTRSRTRAGAKLDIGTKITLISAFIILIALVIIPLVNIFKFSFQPGGTEILREVFTSFVKRQIVLNTVWLGISVGFVGTLVGFLLAYAQVRVKFRGKKILHVISLVPLISPPFAFATAVLILFGRSGFITRDLLGMTPTLYGYPGLMIVLTLSYFPVAYLSLLGMLKNLDPSMEEASASLGASKFRTFWKVTFPLLLPGIASSFLLLFVETIADLANPLVIGGDYMVLSSRAYIAIAGEYNVAAGAAYSMLLLVPGLLVFVFQRKLAGKANVVTVTGKPSGQIAYINNKLGKGLLVALPVFMASFIVLIYGTVIAGGFTKLLGVDNTFSLDHFKYVLTGVGNMALYKTSLMASIATPIAGIMGMLLAWLIVRKLRRGKDLLDWMGMLGIAVPGTVLGIGYAITYNHPLKLGSLTWMVQLAGGAAVFGGGIAIIMVYTVRSIPAGLRSGVASLQQINPAIDEASASLGASGLKTFAKITLPLIRGALLTGLMFAFARSMTTLSPIIFIHTPATPIMTSKILAEVDSGRFGNAFAFCLLLIGLVLLVMGLINLIIKKIGGTVETGAVQ